MDKKIKLIIVTSVCFLASCSHVDYNINDRQLLKANKQNKNGTVIVKGKLIGKAMASANDLSPSDCDGDDGFAIGVDTVLEGKNYLFDRDGEPCNHAKTLFDGKLKVFKRSADPSINISFIDKYGKLPDKDVMLNNEVLDITTVSDVNEDNPEENAMVPYDGTNVNAIKYKNGVVPAIKPKDKKYSESFEPVQLMPAGVSIAGKVSDRDLATAVNRWEQDNSHNKIVTEAEKLLAGVRDLSRKSSDELLEEHQKEIRKLLIKLRGAEKVIEYQKEKERRLRQDIERNQRVLLSERRNNQQEKRKIKNIISQKEQRAREYETIALDLKRKNIETSRLKEQQMLTLRKDLAKAEIAASKTRQDMILAAAKKIAEAEAIASAARKDKRSAMEREANRLSVDASTVLRRAMQIDTGEKIVIPAFDNLKKFEVPAEQYKKRIMQLEERLASLESPKVSSSVVSDKNPVSHPMEDAMVIIKQEDAKLKDIMVDTLNQLSDRIGEWKVEWKLSKRYASIPNEKWTIIAETKFEEFLAYVQEKVKQTHGANLNFRRFNNAHLLVISD